MRDAAASAHPLRFAEAREDRFAVREAALAARVRALRLQDPADERRDHLFEQRLGVANRFDKTGAGVRDLRLIAGEPDHEGTAHFADELDRFSLREKAEAELVTRRCLSVMFDEGPADADVEDQHPPAVHRAENRLQQVEALVFAAIEHRASLLLSRAVGTMTPGRERRSFWRVGPESTWTTVLPVAFIIVSLLSLVILPLIVSNHTATMRQEITRVADPARRGINQIQIDLSSELDKIIAFQVTGQAQYRREYEALYAHEEQNRRLLQKLAPELGSDISDSINDFFVASAQWHPAVRQQEFASRKLPGEVLLARLFEKPPAFGPSPHATSELEAAIQGAIEDRLARIRDAERLNLSLT